ncbi:hypothetical protein F4819DRAFT_483507 [Hypoxylon fuscum]|nr:hypothetical protein F4819DRAFT_483507 [Hypoxylon fuscum]
MTDNALWPHLENRTLVYDPRLAQVTIKKTNGSKYWQLDLKDPTKEDLDCWDLFIDSNGEKTWAQKPGQIPNGYFIARLNLRTLGITGKLFRRYGKLQTIYILKPELRRS